MATATKRAIGTCTFSAARSASGSWPGAAETTRLTPCVPLATTTLLTVLATTSACARPPKSLSPTASRSSGCCTKPTTRKKTLAPRTAIPPRPAVRAASELIGPQARFSPWRSAAHITTAEPVVDRREESREPEEDPDARRGDAGDRHSPTAPRLGVRADLLQAHDPEDETSDRE